MRLIFVLFCVLWLAGCITKFSVHPLSDPSRPSYRAIAVRSKTLVVEPVEAIKTNLWQTRFRAFAASELVARKAGTPRDPQVVMSGEVIELGQDLFPKSEYLTLGLPDPRPHFILSTKPVVIGIVAEPTEAEAHEMQVGYPRRAGRFTPRPPQPNWPGAFVIRLNDATIDPTTSPVLNRKIAYLVKFRGSEHLPVIRAYGPHITIPPPKRKVIHLAEPKSIYELLKEKPWLK